ncbi:MAG: DUF1127 domain-containing protein [Alphaproteobacteria bacterium]|nr:DUF1127 domain-containing protein [Alphaproteobacteria bacterium]
MIRTIPITIREFDLAKGLMDVAKTLYRWQIRAEQRHHLNDLDSHALDDIGLTRQAAKAEARKPFFWT